MQEILKPVQKKFPTISMADIWTVAGCEAIKLAGGPDIPYHYGRVDDMDASSCPPNGRLPDATLGAKHLRDVFYRMGFNDQDIVALSGAHTLGSCHKSRSGFDGPWTTNPLQFDNEYYKNLLQMKWLPKTNDNGTTQYYDEGTGKLMMLPTDIALLEDEQFLHYVKLYAENEEQFRQDFAKAFSELISKGCPEYCQPNYHKEEVSTKLTPEKEFLDLAMHGSVDRMNSVYGTNPSLDVNTTEDGSGRTAAHKASFFGHAHVIDYLAQGFTGIINFDMQDADGDTPLHDASRFGHIAVVEALLKGGANQMIQNNDGKTPYDLAIKHDKPEIATLLAA
jgi:catalase (peroxidase I)